jgi:hypothetical protein
LLQVEALADSVNDVLTDSPAVGLAIVTPANAGTVRAARKAERDSFWTVFILKNLLGEWSL